MKINWHSKQHFLSLCLPFCTANCVVEVENTNHRIYGLLLRIAILSSLRSIHSWMSKWKLTANVTVHLWKCERSLTTNVFHRSMTSVWLYHKKKKKKSKTFPFPMNKNIIKLPLCVACLCHACRTRGGTQLSFWDNWNLSMQRLATARKMSNSCLHWVK